MMTSFTMPVKNAVIYLGLLTAAIDAPWLVIELGGDGARHVRHHHPIGGPQHRKLLAVRSSVETLKATPPQRHVRLAVRAAIAH